MLDNGTNSMASAEIRPWSILVDDNPFLLDFGRALECFFLPLERRGRTMITPQCLFCWELPPPVTTRRSAFHEHQDCETRTSGSKSARCRLRFFLAPILATQHRLEFPSWRTTPIDE